LCRRVRHRDSAGFTAVTRLLIAVVALLSRIDDTVTAALEGAIGATRSVGGVRVAGTEIALLGGLKLAIAAASRQRLQTITSWHCRLTQLHGAESRAAGARD